MKNMYDPATLQELQERLNKLTPASQHLWGKMDVAQMMAHCSIILEVALGDATMKTNFMVKLFAPIIKKTIVSETPFKPNSPTAPDFKVADHHDFEKEKARLASLITRVSNAGGDAMAARKHPLFGALTAQEWSNSQYKHLDHHFRQFGV